MALNKLGLSSWQSSEYKKCAEHLIRIGHFLKVLITIDHRILKFLCCFDTFSPKLLSLYGFKVEKGL